MHVCWTTIWSNGSSTPELKNRQTRISAIKFWGLCIQIWLYDEILQMKTQNGPREKCVHIWQKHAEFRYVLTLHACEGKVDAGEQHGAMKLAEMWSSLLVCSTPLLEWLALDSTDTEWILSIVQFNQSLLEMYAHERDVISSYKGWL